MVLCLFLKKMSKGRKLTEELKAEVAAFYESDEVSRLCPGRKDSVSVRLPSGEKGKKQKRLALANLKEFILFLQGDTP